MHLFTEENRFVLVFVGEYSNNALNHWSLAQKIDRNLMNEQRYSIEDGAQSTLYTGSLVRFKPSSSQILQTYSPKNVLKSPHIVCITSTIRRSYVFYGWDNVRRSCPPQTNDRQSIASNVSNTASSIMSNSYFNLVEM